MWGLPRLGLAAAIGDQHAQEDGQHAARLRGQHHCPQRGVFLHQARRGVQAAGAALSTRLAPQQPPGAALRGPELPGRLGSTLP